MIHGYHLVLSTYGFWLPNDPRGSMSEKVYGTELSKCGRPTKTLERKQVDAVAYQRWRKVADDALLYPPVQLTVPGMWSEGQWIEYLDSEDAIENAIRYVEENPVCEGKNRQHWSFVQPFEGIPRGAWITYY